MSAFGQQRSSGFQRWWGTKCLIFFPCFQKSFIQVNFVNLEKVEVLGLPGGEGELRVRGDKTVRSHNPLKLTGSRSFLYQLIWVVTEQHTTDFLLFPCRGLVQTVPGLLLLLCSTLFSPTCNRRQRIICLKNNNLTSFASHNGCEWVFPAPLTSPSSPTIHRWAVAAALGARAM